MNHSPLMTGLMLSFSVLLIGCAPDSNTAAPDTSAKEASIQSGEEVFMINCSPCHGEGGRGPALSSIQSLTPEARGNAIRNHPTAGQIPQRLPAAQLAQLLDFFENPPATSAE